MRMSKDVLRMLIPSATVFFSSGCIMILELVASRLVARNLGSSLYTWTSIIGVVLAGISVGNYVGGRIADRHHARRALAVLFGLASGACVAILIVNNLVGEWVWLWRLSWPTHVFIHVLLVFFVPSTLLGTISPVVAKMALDRGFPAGRTIGDIYAWGAAGAIAGTFLTGFCLIPTFGSTVIIWGIGAAMLAMGILHWLSCWVLYVWAMIFGALITMGMAPAEWARDAGTAAFLRPLPDPNVLYEDETPYGRVEVRQISKQPDTRVFVQDSLVHGEAIMGDASNLQYFYTRVYAGLTRGLLKGRQDPAVMVIGGGGYAFPQYLKATWPNSRVEVVEIDPGVTEAAVAAFGLDGSARIETVNLDARNYVDQLLRGCGDEPAKQYDFIYEDALDDYSAPFQLVTQEFNDRIARLLAGDGAYMINVIDAYDSGRFLGAVVNTVGRTFPHVYVVASEIGLPSLRGTFVVVATKRPIDPHAILTGYNNRMTFRLLDESDVDYLLTQAGHVILTDDFAPVEHLLTPVVRQGATEILARRYIEQAAKLRGDGKYEESIQRYAQAVSLNPSMALKACNEIGLMHMAQNRLGDAVAAFEEAVKARRGANGKETAAGSVHMNLGMLLNRMKKPKESREHLVKAAEWFRVELKENPRCVGVWDRLGDVQVMLRDFKQASDAFEKALALEPSNASHYRKLALTLESQKRYGEAISVVRKHIQLMRDRGNREAAGQLSYYVELLEYQKVKHRDDSREKQSAP